MVACTGALKPSISTKRVSSVVVRAVERVVLAPPSGKNDEIAVKNLVPNYGGLVDMDEDAGGIGIVKFLRGKVFFITGATGFLAKGNHFFLPSFLPSYKIFI